MSLFILLLYMICILMPSKMTIQVDQLYPNKTNPANTHTAPFTRMS